MSVSGSTGKHGEIHTTAHELFVCECQVWLESMGKYTQQPMNPIHRGKCTQQPMNPIHRAPVNCIKAPQNDTESEMSPFFKIFKKKLLLKISKVFYYKIFQLPVLTCRTSSSVPSLSSKLCPWSKCFPFVCETLYNVLEFCLLVHSYTDQPSEEMNLSSQVNLSWRLFWERLLASGSNALAGRGFIISSIDLWDKINFTSRHVV